MVQGVRIGLPLWGRIIRRGKRGLLGAGSLLLPDLGDAVIWVCSLGENSPSCLILIMRALFCIYVYFNKTSFLSSGSRLEWRE